MPRANRKRLDVRLEPMLFEKVSRSAEEEERTINAQITCLLKEAFYCRWLDRATTALANAERRGQ